MTYQYKFLKAYQEWINATRQKSRYDYKIKPFMEFCEDNNISYENITFEDLNKFLNTLHNKELSAGTINNYNKAIRNFYKFLVKSKIIEGRIENDQVVDSSIYETIAQMKFLPRIKTEKIYFTEEEIADIIEMGTSFIKFDPYKMKAIIWFLFFTGVRLGELLNFKRKDFDFDKAEAIIKTRDKFNPKTYTERRVPLIKEVIDYLQDYFNTEEEKTNAFNMSIAKMNYLFKGLREFAPSGKVFTVKSLRTSFAYMTLRAEDEDGRPLFDIAEVQKLMGHKNIETLLKNYYDPTADEAISRYKQRMNRIRKKSKKEKK